MIASLLSQPRVSAALRSRDEGEGRVSLILDDARVMAHP